MSHNEISPAGGQGQQDSLPAAINSIHADEGVAILTDALAHFSEVGRALEPVLAAIFAQAGSGGGVDLDEVSADLGLLGAAAPDQFNPAERVRPYLERAVEDGEAFREVVTGALLLSDVVTRAAASRAEWSKWEAVVEADLEAAALNLDVFDAARHIARKWLRRDPMVVPAEPALHAVLGFRAAGLPANRSVWRYALDGARAGFEDHQLHVEVEAAVHARNASELAAAFAEEGA